jgi:hypothetical protein
MSAILGGPAELASSRDQAEDKLERELFVQKYQEMHRLVPDADGSVTLYIGAENWPFPIPLVAKNGVWVFDSEAGLKEVLFRRVGENELTAIDICHELVAAEKRLHANRSAADPPASPLANVLSRLVGESADPSEPVLIHGYYFHALAAPPRSGNGPRPTGKATGGLGFIAYPAEYRSSGVMTFVVSRNDVVYEKDLGPNTSTLAAGMGSFHKDASWHAADE